MKGDVGLSLLWLLYHSLSLRLSRANEGKFWLKGCDLWRGWRVGVSLGAADQYGGPLWGSLLYCWDTLGSGGRGCRVALAWLGNPFPVALAGHHCSWRPVTLPGSGCLQILCCQCWEPLCAGGWSAGIAPQAAVLPSS